MNKTYQTCQYLALGVLIGYLAPYALALIKTYRAKPKNEPEN